VIDRRHFEASHIPGNDGTFSIIFSQITKHHISGACEQVDWHRITFEKPLINSSVDQSHETLLSFDVNQFAGSQGHPPCRTSLLYLFTSMPWFLFRLLAQTSLFSTTCARPLGVKKYIVPPGVMAANSTIPNLSRVSK